MFPYKIEKFGSRYKLTMFHSECSACISPNPQKSVNDEKLQNNISRAKSRVLELALCNEWEYFVTLTIDSTKQDRYDLKQYIHDLGIWIGNYNKKYGAKLKYLIVPEEHKDGAYHAHGLFAGVSVDSLVLNEFLYKDMPYYRKRFGYISLDEIRDKNKCSSYITKYVTKQFATNRKKGEHLFYSSAKLNGKEIIHEGYFHSNAGGVSFDFSNEYVSVKWADNIQGIESFICEL